MGYSDLDTLAINTIRLLAVGLSHHNRAYYYGQLQPRYPSTAFRNELSLT